MYEELDDYIGKELSYKKICGITNIKYYTGGKAKDLQIDDIKRYYNLDKINTKYNIIEKLETPIEKVDGRSESSSNNSVKYANDIETVMLYTLQNKKEFRCTISQALLLCKLINENYSIGRKHIPTTSKVLNVDEKNVYMFYDSTSRRLKDTFERALNRMCGKALISYTKDKMVAYNDVKIEENELGEPKLSNKGKISYKVKEIHRKATDAEITIILECEANALINMECIDKQAVFLSHRWNEFIGIVNSEIKSRLNIKYYYESYKIIVNKKHVDWTIRKRESEHCTEIINYTIYESLMSGIDKASEKLDKDGSIKYSEKFINDSRLLIDTTINSDNQRNLKDELLKYKPSTEEDNIISDDGVPF